MNIKWLTAIALILMASHSISAREFKASLFRLKSDGTTMNTGSFQKAIDYISEQGGGTLVFYVGRYLTGSVHLKSNVSIRLEEGAILVGSTSVYDYSGAEGRKALLIADGQQNITISGKGVIEGQGIKLAGHIQQQNSRGFLNATPSDACPALIVLDSCSNIVIEGINLSDACNGVIHLNQCRNISFSGITIKSRIAEKSAGIRLISGDGIKIGHSFIDTSGKEIIIEGDNTEVSVEDCINAQGEKL